MADDSSPRPGSRAKLFTHGGSQAVRLPKEFRFVGKEVTIRRNGEAVILEPLVLDRDARRRDTAALWARIDRLRGNERLQLEPPDDPPAEDVPFKR
ncbi:MAG TPA: AbrB/MazE/SpoVT family DNA-binding domain-containing protein [Caulobacteraceae bacterium]|nr:AbrB/MazE/SpoVT family DNA-binding domain-containing protein [Caulobacteraceae bacterium]